MDRYYEGTFGGPLREDRAVVLLRRPHAVERHQPDAGADRRAVPADRRSAALGSEAHREADDQPDGAGAVSGSPPDRSSRRRCRSRSIRPAGDHTDTPGNLFVANWDGVLANRFFATAQYSRKTNHPRFGNTSTRLQDSPFLTIGRVSPGGLHFGPAYFDRTDPEDRDNNQLTGSVSYFGSRPGLGHA